MRFTPTPPSPDEIEVAVRPCLVWTIRDGRMIAWLLYQRVSRALEAVGCRSRTPAPDSSRVRVAFDQRQQFWLVRSHADREQRTGG